MVLLAIDLQKGLVVEDLYNFEGFVANMKKLLAEARARGVEVIYVRHDAGEGSGMSEGDEDFEFYEELAPLPGEKVFVKTVNSCFSNKELCKYLEEKGEETVIIAGLQTNYCIDASIKSAFDRDYGVIVPEGCNSTFDNDYMTGETTYRYYNEDVWDTFADVVRIEEAFGPWGALGTGLMVQNKGDETMNHIIVPLPKKEWKGVPILLRYTTEEYFDVEITETPDAYEAKLEKKKFETPVTHTPEEYDFPDGLYQDHWEKAEAYGMYTEENGERKLLACIEVCPEEWSNRLMVTELWVDDSLHRQGIGTALMNKAKEIAKAQGRRAIMLETQSCNVRAIAFYKSQGFQLMGFDTCCYTNRDIERREVRFNLVYYMDNREGRF